MMQRGASVCNGFSAGQHSPDTLADWYAGWTERSEAHWWRHRS